MFDFRYHALSLVAVLVALVVGVLLGVAIGDAGLVSSAEKSLRRQIKRDVRTAQRDRDSARDQLAAQIGYANESYPLLVSGRLGGARVGLLFLGSSSAAMAGDVRDAIRPSGGVLAGTLALREPVSVGDLAGSAGATRYDALSPADDRLLAAFGTRIGEQLITGGKLLHRERGALFPTRAGKVGGFDRLVIVRPRSTLKGDDRRRIAAFEDALVRGATRTGAMVVGVEASGSNPTQVPWFRARNLSTVDNVDDVAGAAALVFALAGTSGSFGTGPGAQSLLPGPESVAGP